ncbi:MAG: glycerophosphodiester phosphodiesterase [Gammaproteobacteria bacterium]|nr:MAG: glycerophosphodiester phosphodiesterase [Gammaproteobacteria bacterium]
MLCIGHRGARGHAPENTLLSIRTALQLGAKAIEIDVYCCEGELVVIHDDTVDRTTNGHGPIDRFTLADLRQLDAGKGERIPLLHEVMDLLEGKAAINIELKGTGTAAPTAAMIDHYRQRGWHEDTILVSSFDWSLLAEFRQLDGHSRIGLLTEHAYSPRLDEATQQLGSCAWHCHLSHATTTMRQQAHTQQQALYVYTVNAADDIQRMQQLGVDGVFTDYPERAIPYQASTDNGFCPPPARCGS